MNDQCFSTTVSLGRMLLLASDIRFDTGEYWGGLSARRGGNRQRQCDDIAAVDCNENRCSEVGEQGWWCRT